jgi:hypothetical protein
MKGTLVVYEAFKNLIASGVPPITLQKCKGVDLVDYKIYGESVQDGTPTPDIPVEVESVGDKTKNLFDKSKAKDSYYISSTDGNLAWNANNLATDYIEVKPNTTYCMSENVAKHGAFYNANKEFVSGIIYTSIINVPDDASIKYFRGSATKTLKDTLQIVEDSQITEYEPYGYRIPVKVSNDTEEIITNIYLNEPLRKIDDVADYIDFEKQKVYRKIGKVICNGTENWMNWKRNAWEIKNTDRRSRASHLFIPINIRKKPFLSGN